MAVYFSVVVLRVTYKVQDKSISVSLNSHLCSRLALDEMRNPAEK